MPFSAFYSHTSSYNSQETLTLKTLKKEKTFKFIQISPTLFLVTHP